MKRGKTRRAALRPSGVETNRPMVAIVGRPNVGKSTLFNRLARRSISVVEDIPGVTRDRHYADAWALGRPYVLIDTGGFDPEDTDPMKEGIAMHVKMALEECDIVICAFDATMDPTTADKEAMALLRAAGKPILYATNKADGQKQAMEASTYYELGMEKIYPISALHGRGISALEDALVAHFPKADKIDFEDERVGKEIPRVAIVGRPNAGKSSLLNRLLGEDRQLVDNRPGTTVDAVDTLVKRGDHEMVLIDTAGMRRKARVKRRGVEALSVYQAIRAMERSDVVILMIDANEGVGEQDAKIAGLAVDRGCALVIGMNKSDLMKREDQRQARQRAREILAFAPWAKMCTLSAKTGRGVDRLMSDVAEAVENHRKRISTSEANQFFEEVLAHHPPPTQKSRSVRLYFITQVASAPPSFMVSTNHPHLVHFSYQRYVINQIRERFGFDGTPVLVRYKGKKKRQLES